MRTRLTIHNFPRPTGLDETIVIWLVPCDSSRKRPQRLRTISVNDLHVTFYWSNKRKLLVTADTAHRLYIWDSKLRSVVWRKHYHSDSIVDILLPYKTSILLSASLDTTVIAYDLSSDRVKFRLKAHKRGLISLAYIGSLHMLVTAAAEHSWYFVHPLIPQKVMCAYRNSCFRWHCGSDTRDAARTRGTCDCHDRGIRLARRGIAGQLQHFQVVGYSKDGVHSGITSLHWLYRLFYRHCVSVHAFRLSAAPNLGIAVAAAEPHENRSYVSWI